MSDDPQEHVDIVDELNAWADLIDGLDDRAVITMLSGAVHRAAAVEIARLRDAGDALAAVMRSGGDRGWDNAIDNWEDLRHGNSSPE